MSKTDLDALLERGKHPTFVDIKLTDCPDFLGKLVEGPAFYSANALWPRIVIGEYRGVLVILDVKRI